MNLTQITAQLTEHLRNDTPFNYGGQTFNLRNRQTRIDVIDRITSHIPAVTDADRAALERLADAILYEELTDMDVNKMNREHNPVLFLSEHQFNVRRNSEVSLKAAEERGTDGRNYAMPKRRKRRQHEDNFVDSHAKSRNRDRTIQYRKDTAAGRVETYNLYDTGGELKPEFVTCQGVGQRWKNEMSSVYL